MDAINNRILPPNPERFIEIGDFEELTLCERVSSFAQVFFRAILIVPLFFQQARNDIKLYLNEVITGRRIKIFQEREYPVERVAQQVLAPPVLAPNVPNVPPVTMEILQKDFKHLHAILIARLAFRESEQGFFDKQAFDKELQRLFVVIASMAELEQAEFDKGHSSLENQQKVRKSLEEILYFMGAIGNRAPELIDKNVEKIDALKILQERLLDHITRTVVAGMKNASLGDFTTAWGEIQWKGFSFSPEEKTLKFKYLFQEIQLPITKEEVESLMKVFADLKK